MKTELTLPRLKVFIGLRQKYPNPQWNKINLFIEMCLTYSAKISYLCGFWFIIVLLLTIHYNIRDNKHTYNIRDGQTDQLRAQLKATCPEPWDTDKECRKEKFSNRHRGETDQGYGKTQLCGREGEIKSSLQSTSSADVGSLTSFLYTGMEYVRAAFYFFPRNF